MPETLCVDVGSTFTKAVLVDDVTGRVRGMASTPTTVGTDVMDGYAAVLDALVPPHSRAAPSPGGARPRVLMCSSAGGGLRLAVVGYERLVTAEAGRRVGLSAGAKVVHVGAGPLTGADVRALRSSRPDILLLVGGTDGGNSAVLLHNAGRLASARLKAPVVVAGNTDAVDEVMTVLGSTGRTAVATDNVLPRIGVIRPEPARAAIRETFLHHVIGGKGLSRGRAFADLVQAATPDAMLAGVEVLADVVSGDVMVVDIGGATTDVYSVITPRGEDATLRKDVVETLWHGRTVEADLGMRWNADGIVVAAHAERLLLTDAAASYAARVTGDIGHLPVDDGEWALELELAQAAVTVAARRHARPPSPSGRPRPLADTALLVGSGGVLRHADLDAAARVLDALRHDHAGGWRLPERAAVTVDTAYVLFAVGLLARVDRDVARRLAADIVAGQ